MDVQSTKVTDAVNGLTAAIDEYKNELYSKLNFKIYKEENKEETKMKVMISMPMSNKTDKQIKNRMDELTKKFEAMHIEVIDTYIEDEPGCNFDEYTPALFYLGESIKMLGQVDAVYFDKCWQASRGCCIERRVAEAYGVKILDGTFFDGVVLDIKEDDNEEDIDEGNHIPFID